MLIVWFAVAKRQPNYKLYLVKEEEMQIGIKRFSIFFYITLS